MEKYTAVYPRVSSQKQVNFGTSLDYQEEVCIAKAKELGVPDHLIKVYREEGESGEDIDRTKMNELRDDIKKGLINRLIVLHPDRLSRNMVDRLIVCSEFDKYNVELIFVDVEYKDTEEGKLFFNIQSSISQYELALIKKRTKRGSIKAAQNGDVMGMRVPPYGYDYENKRLIVNKEEAKFVKLIYQWYVYDKLTMREIGEKLFSMGAKPKRGKSLNWNASSIQRILKNETYIGNFYYNKRKTRKVKGEKTVSGKSKRSYELRDKEEWILIKVPLIIDQATFYLAQEQREKNSKDSGNVKHEYLLRQKIRCGHCGNKFSSYTSTSYNRSKKTGEVLARYDTRAYRCIGKQNRKFGEGVEKCASKIMRADHIENYIWNELIMNLVYNTDRIIEEMKNKHEKPSAEIEETYNLLTFKITKIEEEKKRTIKLFQKAYIQEDEMDRDMKILEDTKKDLQKEIEKYEKQMFNIGKNELNIEMLKSQIELIKEKIQQNDEVSFKLKRHIVDLLIDEVILKWEEDKLYISTIGAIEALINHEKLCELSTQQEVI